MNEKIYIPHDFWAEMAGLSGHHKAMCAYFWTIADPLGIVRLRPDKFIEETGECYERRDIDLVEWWVKWVSADEFLIRDYLRTQHAHLTRTNTRQIELWAMIESRWPQGIHEAWEDMGIEKWLPDITGEVRKATGEKISSKWEKKAAHHIENLKTFTAHLNTEHTDVTEAFGRFMTFRFQCMKGATNRSEFTFWEFGPAQAMEEWMTVKDIIRTEGSDIARSRLSDCAKNTWKSPLTAKQLKEIKDEKRYRGKINNTPKAEL